MHLESKKEDYFQNLAAEKTYNNLDVTLREANEHRNEWFEGVQSCKLSETLFTVMEKIVRAETTVPFTSKPRLDDSSQLDHVNQQQTHEKGAPLGDSSLIGVSNILILVSTIELFSSVLTCFRISLMS
ncbi:hypothetical protein TSAR_007905 [Trichomalopsis sarcophagae]|uniref:Uncharacterized protein n=1 Tax=Trichomalopsis sarcophagae TaxID=543379 RepID=A0A232FMQ1_9HYME|nr:hypothetical protein TSAR_007905 [Trichomalopsis sarcophagae]